MTDSDLFPDIQCLSPRLAWMRRHGIETIHSGTIEDEFGEYGPWQACHTATETTVSGDTEDEALASLAAELGIRMWNQ